MQKALDSDKRERILTVLGMGGSRSLAAEFVGCHPKTIRNTASSDPDFAEKLREAESGPEVHFLTTISQAGKGAAHAAKWALERLYPDRYGRRKPGTYSVDAIKELLMELANRLANAAKSEEERVRSLNTMAEFGKEMILATEPFVEEAIPLAKEINALREYFRDVPVGDANGASLGSDMDPDAVQATSTESPTSTQSEPPSGSQAVPGSGKEPDPGQATPVESPTHTNFAQNSTLAHNRKHQGIGIESSLEQSGFSSITKT